MKKVPHWIQKVILASQKVYCADARNKLLDNMISGEFDYNKFKEWCKDTYNITVYGRPTIADNYWDAVDKCDDYTEPKNIQRLINEEGL